MTDRFVDRQSATENAACHGGVPWLTLATAALALLLYLQAGPAAPELVYDRGAIEAGQWWRLFSGHLVHSDMSHLAWDLGGLLVLGWLFEGRLSPRRFLIVMVSGMVSVDVWLWWGQAPLRYCGMSGFLNTLLASGLVQQWRSERGWLIPLVGIGAASKIAWESLCGQALLTATAWPAVPLAHAAGFAGGLLVVLTWSEKPGRFSFRSRGGRHAARVRETRAGC